MKTTTQKTEATETQNVRRVRAVLPRPIYRLLTIYAAEQEATVNEVFIKAVTEYAMNTPRTTGA